MCYHFVVSNCLLVTKISRRNLLGSCEEKLTFNKLFIAKAKGFTKTQTLKGKSKVISSQQSREPKTTIGITIGNPGSLCVTRDITQVNYREHMRRSLGLKICWKVEMKIDETYHVASFGCPLYVHVVFGKSSLHHLSFIVKWQGRRLKANSGSDRPKKSTIFFAKIESTR